MELGQFAICQRKKKKRGRDVLKLKRVQWEASMISENEPTNLAGTGKPALSDVQGWLACSTEEKSNCACNRAERGKQRRFNEDGERRGDCQLWDNSQVCKTPDHVTAKKPEGRNCGEYDGKKRESNMVTDMLAAL